MAYEIIFKKRFTNKLLKVLIYLEKEWSHKVATNFRISQLSRQPFTGIASEKIEVIRSVFITRHNRVYYKVKGEKVIILNMYDTRMNPKKKKY
jgi:Txe/YoeB family toxin of Txe-Axe toxin-antitoxin module